MYYLEKKRQTKLLNNRGEKILKTGAMYYFYMALIKQQKTWGNQTDILTRA